MNVLCIHYPAGATDAVLHAVAEAAMRYSSQVAVRPGDAVFVETGRSRGLFGTENLRLRLQALAGRFPAPVAPRLGAGAHAAEALARARFGASLPLEAFECYASPFKADEEIAQQMRVLGAALRELGVADLDAFLALPFQHLGERFGPNAALLRERIAGRLDMAWPRFTPAARLEEAQDLLAVESQAPCSTAEDLAFHLKQACDRVAARLRGLGLRAAGLELRLDFERTRGVLDAAPWVLALELPLPLAAPRALQQLAQLRLEAHAQRHRIPRPIAALRLRVTATAPGFSPQREAFDRREDEQEALHSVLARLTQRLGEDQVFYALLLERHLPEQAWRREAPPKEAEAVAPPPMPEPVDVARPSRLLRRPLLLSRSEDWLIYWGGGKKARRWRAVGWDGPERLSQPWWQDRSAWDVDTPARDYWRVHTAQGMDLWVFSRQGEEAGSGALWLQGWWG